MGLIFRYSTKLDPQVCPYCAALEGMIVNRASSEYFQFLPPQHFRCRCIWSALGFEDEIGKEFVNMNKLHKFLAVAKTDLGRVSKQIGTIAKDLPVSARRELARNLRDKIKAFRDLEQAEKLAKAGRQVEAVSGLKSLRKPLAPAAILREKFAFAIKAPAVETLGGLAARSFARDIDNYARILGVKLPADVSVIETWPMDRIKRLWTRLNKGYLAVLREPGKIMRKEKRLDRLAVAKVKREEARRLK